MMKFALGALFAGLVACGGGDAPILIDAPNDATGAVCNPIAQTGCAANEKCTWITDQVTPTEVGHIGCTPDGTVATGGACVEGPPGPQGFDDCVKGDICIAGVCKNICDPQQLGAASGCDEEHSCSRYSGLFVAGGMITAGACDPKCDLLTQRLLVAVNGRTEACGSEDPAAPRAGCYPTAGFQGGSCAPVRADDPELPAGELQHLDRTDREPSLENEQGEAFLNGCAPGYTAFFFENDASMRALCTGICAPFPGGLSNVNNATTGPNSGGGAVNTGDVAALVKLPRQPAPAAGHGTCNATGAKGSTAANGGVLTGPERCVYLWPFLADDAGTPDPMDTAGETIGFCFPHTFFRYANDPDMIEDTEFPDFNSLPPPTDGLTSNFPTSFLDTCDGVVRSAIATCTKAQAGFPFNAQAKKGNHVPSVKMFHVGGIDGGGKKLRR
jgi:hypothetical protein